MVFPWPPHGLDNVERPLHSVVDMTAGTTLCGLNFADRRRPQVIGRCKADSCVVHDVALGTNPDMDLTMPPVRGFFLEGLVDRPGRFMPWAERVVISGRHVT